MMLALIFLLIILTVCDIRNEDIIVVSNKIQELLENTTLPQISTTEIDTIFTDQTNTTVFSTSESDENVTSQQTSPDTSEQTSISIETSSGQTSVESTTSNPIISSAATQPPIIPRYRCDFTTPCFADDQLNRTNGSQFYHSTLHNNTKPPLAPTSDITSIIEPTADDQYCQLPYHLPLDNASQTTGWNVWFCYQQQCPTIDEQWATCASGLYALISLDSNQKSKTIIDSLLTFNDEQCLRFYYYFTVNEQQSDWGQQIQVWIRPENQTEHRFLLSNLTVMNMTDYKWESNEVTFNVKSLNYTLEFVFEVTMINENEEVYFALDNLEVYDYNCSYVIIPTTTISTESTSVPITSTTTTRSREIPTTPGTNLGMIVGLCLGIGMPVLLILIGILILYKNQYKKTDADNYDILLTDPGTRTDSDIFDNPFLF